MTSKKDTLFNLATGLISVIVQFAISFFLSPFIVKSLGAEANGFSQLAANFVMYASLVTLAFNSMASRFITVAYHKNEIEKARMYYTSVYVVNIVLCMIFIPLAIITTFKLQDIIVIENTDVKDVKLLFACVFANFLINMIISMYSIAFYVRNKLFYSNSLSCVRTILNAFLLLALFNIFPVKIFYVSFAALVLALIQLPIYKRFQLSLLPDVRFSRKYFRLSAVKEMVLSGVWNTINQCGHLLNTGLDLLLSNWFITPFAMGLIAISKTIPAAVIQLASTINNNFSPSITQSWAVGGNEEMIKELRSSMKISSIVVSIPMVTFCCIGFDFYRLWQPSLDPHILTVLSILGCMAFIPVSGTQVLYNVFTATNKLSVNSISFVVMGMLNVLIVYLCLMYLPQYGLYAIAGVSSILSITRQMVFILPYVAKLINVKWYTFYKDVAISMMCAIINISISFFVLYLFPHDSWFGLIINTSIIILLTVAADIFVILKKQERNVLKSIIKMKIRI